MKLVFGVRQTLVEKIDAFNLFIYNPLQRRVKRSITFQLILTSLIKILAEAQKKPPDSRGLWPHLLTAAAIKPNKMVFRRL